MVFDANEFFNEHHSEPEEVSWPKRSPNDFSIDELMSYSVPVLFIKAGVYNDDFKEGSYSTHWVKRLSEYRAEMRQAKHFDEVQRTQEKIAEINSYDSLLNNDIEPVDQQREQEGAKDKQQKRLIPQERDTTELLVLIYRIFDFYSIKVGDELSKLPAKEAWGYLITRKFESELIKNVEGTRKTAYIELNGGEQVDYRTFARTYNRRFK